MKIAVLISGGGTTLTNLHDQVRSGTLNVEIPLVIASNACAGVQRATDIGLRAEVVQRGDFQSVDEFSGAIFDLVRSVEAELVVLAGFLSLVRIPDDFEHRVMNIHPSLIPSFSGKGYYGHRVHEAAIERGVKISGCTVHFADNAYDHGPIILQRTVAVPDSATPDELAKLVFEQEKIAYPDAIRLFLEGRLKIEGQRVIVQS